MEKILIFATQNDLTGELWWNDELQFFINCNDLFYWGTADLEQITEENFPILEQAKNDSRDFAADLFCARVRKMRPQKPYYKYLKPETAALFDACGPDRGLTDALPAPEHVATATDGDGAGFLAGGG